MYVFSVEHEDFYFIFRTRDGFELRLLRHYLIYTLEARNTFNVNWRSSFLIICMCTKGQK